MNNPDCAETAALVAGLLVGSVAIRSVWSMGVNSTLIVFADAATLRRLRDGPHAPGIELLVVTDGDRVESAWHAERARGSLAGWAWQQTSANEAFYDEARWAEDGATVVRVRRKARLVWRTPAGAK